MKTPRSVTIGASRRGVGGGEGAMFWKQRPRNQREARPSFSLAKPFFAAARAASIAWRLSAADGRRSNAFLPADLDSLASHGQTASNASKAGSEGAGSLPDFAGAFGGRFLSKGSPDRRVRVLRTDVSGFLIGHVCPSFLRREPRSGELGTGRRPGPSRRCYRRSDAHVRRR